MDFEKSVMTEIFPSLVDSICVDSRKMDPPPPMAEPVFDKTGHYVRTDSTKATKKQISEYIKWQKERDKLEKDTSTVFIAFDPFLKKHEKLIEESKFYFPKVEIFKTKNVEESKFSFDFEKIKLNNRFKLKKITEFPKVDFPSRITDLKYNFVFSGVFYLSRIEFDKQKKLGVLEGSFDFCGKCGRYFIILIKKVNNKWVIDKLQLTGVS
ncbi:hypothetical protein [Flavobacterium taihuense]|uniref:Uncharacterized protein n=1 Tax=Flavobacterium taihuense TaxID=2857508 RepID=A0ABS6Y1H1_9FLAO|nr:hypothetical protein [Flavobacterium taihuense]MBW4361938.1 hypothetical protein [Flavobacterium taihuense]